MKKFVIWLFVLNLSLSMQGQTLHTIMMCNMNDRTLARGNEGEVREMRSLIPTLATS